MRAVYVLLGVDHRRAAEHDADLVGCGVELVRRERLFVRQAADDEDDDVRGAILAAGQDRVLGVEQLVLGGLVDDLAQHRLVLRVDVDGALEAARNR